jgi:Holliday junction resolvasome RuvABC endonuclease subunit
MMEADYLGIDPGLNGGFACVSGDKISYKMAMPTISFTTTDGKTKTELDRKGICSFLSALPPHTHAVIEEQGAYRGQDITSSCTICRNYGILQMALTTAHMFITEVPSDVWQAHFRIVSVKKGEGKTTKQQALEIAQAKYPDADFRKSGRAHKAHDGIVDAALIADYCQSLFAPFPQLIEPLEVKPIVGIEGTVKSLECKPGGKESGIKLQRRMF